jgi:uncharacterized membrane protein YraQ (UPF0718 family)
MMDRETIIMAGVALALLAAAYLRGGDLWVSGLKAGVSNFWRLLPVLLISFLIAGLMQVLVPRAQLVEWLGRAAGLRGILTGCVVGALIPGPPYAMFPLVASLYGGGAGIGAVVGLLAGKALWNVHHIPSAVALLGPRLTVVRYLIMLPFAPLAGVMAEVALAVLL